MKVWLVVTAVLVPICAFAQSAGTLSLPTGTGVITPSTLSSAINGALGSKADYSGLVAEAATARSSESANANAITQESNTARNNEAAALAAGQNAQTTANAALPNANAVTAIAPGKVPLFSNYNGSGFPGLTTNSGPLVLSNTSTTAPLFLT